MFFELISLHALFCFVNFLCSPSSKLLLHFSDLTPHRWFGFSFIYMGRLFHLFPGIRVNPVVLPIKFRRFPLAPNGGALRSDLHSLGLQGAKAAIPLGVHLKFEPFCGGSISEKFRQFCFFTKRSTLLLEKSRKINFLHLFFIEQHAKLLPFLLMLVD